MMGRLLQLLSANTGSRLRQNFVRLARANILAMVLPLLATPLLTRLFAPADYGALAIFTSIVALVVSFSTWRFDWAMPNARSTGMAATLFALGAIVTAVVCVIGLIVIALAKAVPWLHDAADALGPLIYLIPVAVAAGSARQLLSGWFVRLGDLGIVGRVTWAQSAVNVAVSFATGFVKLGATGLIIANVVAAWAGIGALIRLSREKLGTGLRRLTRRRLAAGLVRYGGQSTWSSLVAIVNALSHSAPVLVLAWYFSPGELGWYAMMQRLVAAPTSAMSAALGQSFWSEAASLARARRYQELSRLYRRTTLRLLVACIPVVLGCLAGSFVVGPLLGHGWDGAGWVLLAMCPMFVGWILFSPTSHLTVLELQHLQLIADGVRLGLIAGMVSVAAVLGWGFIWAVAAVSTSSFAGGLLLFAVHLMAHRIRIRKA